MVSYGTACRILIKNIEQLLQVDVFPYIGSLITEDCDWWVYNSVLYQVKQGAGDRGITAENMEKSQHTDFNENMTDESASVVCTNVWLWKMDSAEKESVGFVVSKENKWVGS